MLTALCAEVVLWPLAACHPLLLVHLSCHCHHLSRPSYRAHAVFPSSFDLLSVLQKLFITVRNNSLVVTLLATELRNSCQSKRHMWNLTWSWMATNFMLLFVLHSTKSIILAPLAPLVEGRTLLLSHIAVFCKRYGLYMGTCYCSDFSETGAESSLWKVRYRWREAMCSGRITMVI